MKNYREFNFFKEKSYKKNTENIIHISIVIIVVIYIGATYINNYILYNKYKTIARSPEVNMTNNLKSKISYNQIKEIYYQNNLVKIDEVYSDENYIYIKGNSNNLNLISQYSKKLESSNLFKIVFIENIKAIQPQNINQFELKCTLKEETI